MKKGLVLIAWVIFSAPAVALEHGCSASAQSLFLACGFDVKEGFLEGLAICGDTTDTSAAEDCIADRDEVSLEIALGWPPRRP